MVYFVFDFFDIFWGGWEYFGVYGYFFGETVIECDKLFFFFLVITDLLVCIIVMSFIVINDFVGKEFFVFL